MADHSDNNSFLQDALIGLAKPEPEISSKYLYDELGSVLFEAICVTPEYYVTRTDLKILDDHLPEISRCIGPQAHVIEFGSGAGVKTSHLLDSLEQPTAYSPIEISAAALDVSAAHLRRQFPNLGIYPIQADYTQPISSTDLDICQGCKTRVVYFPGSTIGNFTLDQAQHFLQRIQKIASKFLPEVSGGLLIGIDLMKPMDVLIPAYDDAAGVTAAFNKNLLARMNNELGADFDLTLWGHQARFNNEHQRVEMHLVSKQQQTVSLGGQTFEFSAGASIHTENSHKYTLESFSAMAAKAGLELKQYWTDSNQWFATCYFVPKT